MGVLGWPPDVVRAAALEDLAEAYEGYRLLSAPGGNNPPAPQPAKDFMADIMKQFPDKGTRR